MGTDRQGFTTGFIERIKGAIKCQNAARGNNENVVFINARGEMLNMPVFAVYLREGQERSLKERPMRGDLVSMETG